MKQDPLAPGIQFPHDNSVLARELLGGKREQFQIEKQYRRKDGSLIWVSNNVSLVPGTDSTPPGEERRQPGRRKRRDE